MPRWAAPPSATGLSPTMRQPAGAAPSARQASRRLAGEADVAHHRHGHAALAQRRQHREAVGVGVPALGPGAAVVEPSGEVRVDARHVREQPLVEGAVPLAALVVARAVLRAGGSQRHRLRPAGAPREVQDAGEQGGGGGAHRASLPGTE